MPSTYSSNLKIELIATGEQDGTWGSTTNTNLGTALEQAITGVGTITFASADVTLSFVSSNAAQDFRNIRLILTGTTAGPRNLIVPNIQKLYFIDNQTADTITVKTALGSGVAVPSNAKSVMFVNTTNVVEAITHFNSLTAVSPTFSGTPTAPTAAPSTSTTQIATTEFVLANQTPLATILQTVYPVGSIYLNATNAVNPGTLLGFGTWVAFGAGRMPVGFDAGDPLFDTAEETGGSKNAIVVSHTHTGSTDSAGAHTHNLTGWLSPQSPGQGGGASGAQRLSGEATYTTNSAGSHAHTFTTDSTGSSGTNANLPPYITVYMWKRTA